MSSVLEPLAHWLVDVYAGAAIILTIIFVIAWRMRQPAQRLTLAWATVIGIVALSAMAAIPHWPRFHWVPPPSPTSLTVNGTIALDQTQELADSSGDTDLSLWRARVLDVGTVEKALASIRRASPTDTTATTTATGSASSPESSDGLSGQAEYAWFVLLRPLVNDNIPSWVAWTVGTFTAGGLIAILWLMIGAARAIWLFRRSRVAPSGFHSLLRKVIGVQKREPALRLSEAVGQPVAMGTVRPAILLPTPQAEQVPPPQLEAVLAHEWAHIRRGDLWLLAAIRLMLVLFFAHPLYWWLRNRIRQDQEAIADAAAVGYGSAVDYAATLVAWCRLGGERHSAVLAFGGRPSQLKRRIAMLLNPDWRVETRCPRRLQWGIGAIALVGVLALSVLTLRPGNPVNADETDSTIATTNGEEPAAVTARVREVQGAPVAQRPLGKTYVAAVLAGTVVSPDGKALDGAQVAVLAWSKNSPSRTEKLGQTKTNAQGEFRVSVMCPAPAGDFEVVTVATAPGFGPSWTNGLSSELKITLPAERVIQGKLIDLEGQPAAGVKLYVSRIGTRPSNNGNYFYTPLKMDTLTFDESEDEMPNQNAFASGFFMNARVMRSNEQVMVTVGEDGKPPALPAVERVVFSEPSAALPNWPAAVTTDAGGHFTIRGIGAGQGAGLQVRDDRFALQALDVPPQMKGKGEPVTLALAPARTLDGTVTAADTGKPIPHARLFVDAPSSNGSILLSFAGLGSIGSADSRGRQGLGSNGSFITLALAGAQNSPDELSGVEIQADENGRFRLNLPATDNVSIHVAAPEGKPFLNRNVGIQWKKGMTRLTRDIQLIRGVQVRGKVTEQSTGKPVSAARVDFWSKGLKLPEGVQAPSAIKTNKDGTFQVLLPAAKWHVLVNATKPNYVCQKIRVDELGDDQTPQIDFNAVDENGEKQEVKIEQPSVPQYYYPDAWQLVELAEGTTPPELNISLRQVMLKGQLVGPDGKPVKKAMLFFNHPVPPASHSGFYTSSGQAVIGFAFSGSAPDSMTDPRAAIQPKKAAKVAVELADGRFEIPLRDLDAPYRVIFLDSENGNGGTAVFTGKDVNEEPVQVKLAPCGTIKARFVDENGKPLAKHRPLVWAILGEQKADAKDLRLEFNPENLRSDRAVWAGHLDVGKHGDDFRTDAQGAIMIRNVVPGVTYRIWNGTEWEGYKITSDDGWRDFTVDPGKTIETPAIKLQREKIVPKPATK